MTNCIIIDDEIYARDSLDLMLSLYFSDRIKVVGKAISVKEGVQMINDHNPDLVFLDIQMPEENGFKLFNYFNQVRFSVIFTTAYQEFAIKAFKVAALDYILKPVSPEDLNIAIKLHEKRHLSGISLESIEILVNALNPGSLNIGKIALPTFKGFQIEKINDIMYCVADLNYTRVFTVNGGEVIVSKQLNTIESLLPEKLFYRIHKSHLVNLNYIKSYNRTDGLNIVLENGTKLVVSVRRKEDFLRVLMSRY